MGSMKGDSRMDVAALTGSDSNYFDTQDYVFIRRAQNNETLPSLHLTTPPQKNTPSVVPASTPPPQQHSSTQQEQQEADEHAGVASSEDEQQQGKCTLTYCCVCTHGLPPSFQNPPTWSEVCRVAMYALELANQDRKYFHIRKEICPFIEGHYEILVPQTKSNAWRQTVNMTLSHPQYAHLFMQESQDHEYGRRKGAMPGYYCLRQRIDLYKLPEPEKRIRRKRLLEEVAADKKASANSEIEYDSDASHSYYTHPHQPNATPITTTTTSTTTTEATENDSETENDKPTKKGLIKKLETDLFLYFLERKEENLGDTTLAPLTALSPSSQSPAPVSTPLPSIPALAETKSSLPKPSDLPCLPPLSSLPHFNSSKASPSSNSTANSAIPPHVAPKTAIGVAQLINNDTRTDNSSLFAQWQAKSSSTGTSEPNASINWNIKRDPSLLSRSPQQDSSSSSYPSPSSIITQKFPLTGKYDQLDEYSSRSAQYSSSPSSKFSSSSGRPLSPVSNKPAPYGGLFPSPPPPPPPSHLSSYGGSLKRSGSPVWQYEQAPSASFSQFSPPPYPPPYPSPYSSHPSPYQFTPPSFQKDSQPLPPPHSFSSTSTPPTASIQIHQSPLQQKQPPKAQPSPPSTPSSQPPTSSSTPSSSPSPSSSSSSSSQKSQQAIQAQQPQRRNRLTTRPWERAILEDYYISFFCQSRHSRREKVKVEELVKKLGWEISRIQRWLDNRRTKDRPRFGHPEFGATKNEEGESDDDDEQDAPTKRGDPPLSPTSPPKLLAALKNRNINTSANTTTNTNTNGRKTNNNNNNKRKNTDEDESSPSPSPSPPSSSPPPPLSSSSSSSIPTSIKKRKPLPSSSSTPLPPNPNQANTDFWVIKNK